MLKTKALNLLENKGFVIVDEEEITFDGLVNPADVRSKAAEVLSQAGFEGYQLKEVYFYKGSKKPYRTDATGYIELCPTDEFAFKQKLQFKEKI